MSFINPKACTSGLALSVGMTVADFGSGAGAFSLCAAEYVGNTGKVYAIDIKKDVLTKLVNEARERGLKNIKTIWGNVEEEGGTMLPDESCDAVICANLLFQVENKDAVFKEAYRVLKPGGKLIIIDWTDSHGGLGPRKDDVFSKDDAKSLAYSNGFEFKEKLPAGEYHYCLIFNKKDE